MRSIRFHARLAAVLAALSLAAMPPVPAAAATQPQNPLWPINFHTEQNAVAKTVPVRFYQAIDTHHYQSALSLLTPRSRETYADMASMQYFANLKNVSVTGLQDITKRAGPLRLSADRYAAVKVYLGKVEAVATDGKQQALLAQWPYHRFVVVQEKRGGPWLLDDDEAMTSRMAHTRWPQIVPPAGSPSPGS